MTRIFLKYLANLQLAIFLLLVIAVNSAIGSVIEQDKTINFYIVNYPNKVLTFPLWKIFLFLGFDHIYTTWWFLFILFIFGLCLISCTALQQLPGLKFSRRYYFYKQLKQFNKLDIKFENNLIKLNKVCYKLIKQSYSVFQNNKGVYAYKGLVSRIGPIIVHFSIIGILFGAVFGSLKGFSAQEFIPTTETFHIQNTLKVGPLSKIPQNNIRVNDFWVNYTSEGKIKQFYSQVSFLTGLAEEIDEKTMSVNNPVIFKDLTLYQTDWGIIGLRFYDEALNTNIQLPVTRIENSKSWISWLSSNSTSQNGFIILINDSRGQIEIYDQNANLISQINLDDEIILNNKTRLRLTELILSTGLQIKSDPGVKIIYVGFGCLIISSLVSYISFSEVWFLIDRNKIFWGGQTNRAKIQFRIELTKLKNLFPPKK